MALRYLSTVPLIGAKFGYYYTTTRNVIGNVTSKTSMTFTYGATGAGTRGKGRVGGTRCVGQGRERALPLALPIGGVARPKPPACDACCTMNAPAHAFVLPKRASVAACPDLPVGMRA
jgi:hypothetical protein